MCLKVSRLPDRTMWPAPLLVLALVAASAGVPSAWAAPTPPKSSAPASTPSDDPAAEAARARARAKTLYSKAYEETERAKADLVAKKDKDAAKRFSKALKQFDEATRLDPAYFEAWNMVGYCARKTGDLKRAFAAYEKSLAINPDYEEAHEYLGEAWLLSGDIAKAREQLAWLKEKQSEEAAELEASIEAAEKAKAAAGAP